MQFAPLDDETLSSAVQAYKEFGTISEAARQLNIPRRTLGRRIHVAAKRGMLGYDPVLPGFEIKKTSTQRGPNGELQREWIQQQAASGAKFRPPEGHRVKGVSAYVDETGRTRAQWIKTKEGDLDPLVVAEKLKAAFSDYAPAAPSISPPSTDDDRFTVYPFGDTHFGMYAWRRETAQNWNLDVAEKIIGGSMQDLISLTPSTREAILLCGGDIIHSDNDENRTAKSGNPLDVDGRHAKVIETACRVLVRTIDALRAKHEQVYVRILKGNHDEYSTVALTYFLLAWYRNEPRVTIDDSPNLYFVMRRGSVMLAATHGHTVKAHQMPGILAQRWAKDWGATEFRYCHMFHVHHVSKVATESNGVICESHSAPIPQDAWHWGAGFLSGRAVSAITYSEQFGEVSRNRVAILDG